MTPYEVRAVSYAHRRNGQSVPALVDIDLNIGAGEFLAIAGPSGSGKTTLLNLLGLLDTPDTGTIRFDDADVLALAEHRRTRLRRERLAFIFQSFNLIPTLTAYENVERALLARTLPPTERRCRTLDALAAVGVAEQGRQRPNRMSGGQQQRAAMARASGESGLAIAFEHILEATVLAVLGAALGLACGWALAAGPLHDGVAMPPAPGITRTFRIQIELSLADGLQALGLAMLTAIGGCLLPVWRAVRIPIADALRHA